MFHRSFLFAVIVMSLASCFSPRVLSKKDYIRMSDDEIRSVLLEHAPIGSSKKRVENIIRSVFRADYEQKNYVVRLDPRNFACSVEDGDYTLRSWLQSYGWAKNFFLAGNFVEAFWLFSKDGILKDVQVSHSWDGV